MATFPRSSGSPRTPTGCRKTYDTPCINAPDTATDAELLDGLATDFAIDLSEAPTRVVKFAVAYLGNRVTTMPPLHRGHQADDGQAPGRGD